jgi:hypothetical protein
MEPESIFSPKVNICMVSIINIRVWAVRFNPSLHHGFVCPVSFVPLGTVLDGGKRSTSCPCCFAPGNNPVLIDWEAGWVSELVWTVLENRQSLAPLHNYLQRHTVRFCSFCIVYPIVTITSEFIVAVFKLSKLAQCKIGSSNNTCDLT